MEASDDAIKEASDDKVKQDILQSTVLVKEQFLIGEVRLLVDDGSKAQASVPKGQLTKRVKGN